MFLSLWGENKLKVKNKKMHEKDQLDLPLL